MIDVAVRLSMEQIENSRLSREVYDLKRLITELKRGDCWCEVGIGNPMMQGEHSDTCKAIMEGFGLKS